jgi:hypothetical protein
VVVVMMVVVNWFAARGTLWEIVRSVCSAYLNAKAQCTFVMENRWKSHEMGVVYHKQ